MKVSKLLTLLIVLAAISVPVFANGKENRSEEEHKREGTTSNRRQNAGRRCAACR